MYGFGGNFAWMGLHLWYLEAVFIFSLLCLPLFLWFKNRASGRRVLQIVGDFLAKPGAAYLLALPMIVLVNLLDPESWSTTVVGDPSFGTLGYGKGYALYCVSTWCWLLVVFGFGMKHLNRSTPFLTHANEAVLPFYILHLTMIVILSYFVLQWDIPDLLQWLIIFIGSFILFMTVYELLVRRFNLMRFLFGMKLISKTPTVQPGEMIETLPPA